MSFLNDRITLYTRFRIIDTLAKVSLFCYFWSSDTSEKATSVQCVSRCTTMMKLIVLWSAATIVTDGSTLVRHLIAFILSSVKKHTMHISSWKYLSVNSTNEYEEICTFSMRLL